MDIENKVSDAGSDPAFPVLSPVGPDGLIPSGYPFPAEGLTKREWFAGKAMQGLRAYSDQMAPEYYAKRAVADADALIAELAKERP